MYMFKYILKRIGLMLFTFSVIMLICFVLIKSLPIPLNDGLGKDKELLEANLRARGYYDPIMVQLGHYIERIFTDFHELAGDRAFADDKAIVGGLARLNGRPVMIIGHQKGRDIRERTLRNFGMPRPEGYRKAMRLMKLAERFNIPVLTFIDTPGAYPGVGAEERSQAGAIAESLKLMSDLNVPIICTVIGEGGSGGALAIGVGDRVNMLQYSTYSVISPEGCASILWKSAEKAPLAAEAMNITAHRIKDLGLIDNVVQEPLGGAHRNYDAMAENLKQRLEQDLAELSDMPSDRIIEQRFSRLMKYGYC